MQSSTFNWLVAGALILNVINVSMETASLNHTLPVFLPVIDSIFLLVYFLEFSMKLLAAPVEYWKNYYNIFDVIVLLIASLHFILAMVFMNQPSSLAFKIILGKGRNSGGGSRPPLPIYIAQMFSVCAWCDCSSD